ncbi:2-C-methyl-D-erythritol 4-phosphate cytidylyltransferase [Nocardioides sp. GY 10113]|uniref:2-C-methyl-D-erythritol 4-phosphate cytidylyltransferase n=1 Tax=Nocardioides sp. GY 10113 TaxID=2569761 RepID=UPI0010A8224F|nr:2-C-methyl-D-erythritol 4-phosphate cytidylyltransferase [Nocardioides sp. GY 10113]TIC88445.1 2-C-methyl-D-erythritol 4-phosphate cytidylyltransferase [Nocardioides sp. GY 10113]
MSTLPPEEPTPYGASAEPTPELEPASGVIVDEGRGALPFALIHGESLVATAAWSAGEAGIELIDASLGWDVVVDREEPLVLHDPLCPMTPPEFLADCVRAALATGEVVVGVRPVTDTVKEVVGGRIGATVDRESLVAVCSPLVLPPALLARLVGEGGLPAAGFAEQVAFLRERDYPVLLVDAPAGARRVTSVADVAVLEAQTRPAR